MEEKSNFNIASEKSLEKAIINGMLEEPQYTVGLYDYTEIISEIEKKIQICDDKSKRLAANNELNKLKDILNKAINELPSFFEKNLTNKNGKYIIYCRNIEEIKKYISEAKKLFSSVNSEIEIFELYSKHNNIEETIKKFESNEENNKLKLLFSLEPLNPNNKLKNIDGVIIMKSNRAPTQYYKQLGQALSLQYTKKPNIIELVNNLDTVEIIEEFKKKIDNTKNQPLIKEFNLSNKFLIIQKTLSKIYEILGRKRYRLTNEEKYNLMIDYMKETGESITVDTRYRGYNIGYLKNNLRQLYYSGMLKIEDELLEKFIESGIIIENKEKNRTSQKEKYDFLMSMEGKEEEELHSARMSSGLSYFNAKRQIQHDYNKGVLRLDEEQVKNLIVKGIITFSKKEKEKISNQCGLPKKYATEIIKKYGTFENFLNLYKNFDIDFQFPQSVFCGYRGITLFSNKITESQKMAFITLLKDLLGDDFCVDYKSGDYIDLDIFYMLIESILDEEEKNILTLSYGLKNNRIVEEQIGKMIGKSEANVSRIKNKAMRKLKCNLQKIQKCIKNINDELDKNNEKEYKVEEKRYNKALKNYINAENIFDPDGKVLPVEPNLSKSLHDFEYSYNTPIKELGLSTTAYNIAIKNCVSSKEYGEYTIGSLMIRLESEKKNGCDICNPKQLKKFLEHGSGIKSVTEIVNKLKEVGILNSTKFVNEEKSKSSKKELISSIFEKKQKVVELKNKLKETKSNEENISKK